MITGGTPLCFPFCPHPQALLANISALYAIYHGPKGLKDIAKRVHLTTMVLAQGKKQNLFFLPMMGWVIAYCHRCD